MYVIITSKITKKLDIFCEEEHIYTEKPTIALPIQN